ncbi:ABC transporter ATP-binding protein [Candidatus Borrarchaeum sp.]|uniref:ABC transporter ATP-binding protein n=1 Tax=Candidatus Borrarchaeum sp. TaxID=2846742 RepID=UPI00257951B8|nr:ABC transporter ATP-binding protein [Candidatus Borrarchaeum sp.]
MPENSEIVVEAIDLKKEYHLGDVIVPALRGINLQIKKGEFLVIMGPSGSGKSTLLNMIGGLDNPTAGQVFINGQDISKLSDSALTELRAREIGFIFQFYNLVPVLTALENVELPMMVTGVAEKEGKKRAIELLEMVGLGDRLHHRPDELSGGQRQRVSIARALANTPSIVLADEPTGDVDTKTGDEILDIMHHLNKNMGVTMIVITHDPVVSEHCDRLIRIIDGLIATDKPTARRLLEISDEELRAYRGITGYISDQR